MWLIITPVIIIGVATILSFICTIHRKKRTAEEKINASSSPRRSLSLSRSRTNDTRNPRPYSSHKPNSGRPTGEMGAARAALGATIHPPTPLPLPPQMEQAPIIHGRPTGQMGAARAALGATIEPGVTGLGIQNVPIQWDSGCVVTRPEAARINTVTQEPGSVYSLRARPGENTTQMMQRVDEELRFHQAVSRYPIFADSVPSTALPVLRESRRETRERRENRQMTLDEEVNRQVASFPIFQQNSRNGYQHVIPTGNNGEEYREVTTNTNTTRDGDDDELWREVATLPLFQNTPTYRSTPTRRPDPLTPRFVTPPPAYEYAPAYGEDDGIGARDGYASGLGLGSQGRNGGFGDNGGVGPAALPPAYVRYEGRR
ncbi:predicted protein [Sclerotinia sclerotiorum 1980 UF-70]|nr:predicted protein [Sclerotinia sclerotiorum 1980 UF-70]EDN99129.1 predicted protein [Sclerotinia sclerotiorum 1980 UF-70]